MGMRSWTQLILSHGQVSGIRRSTQRSQVFSVGSFSECGDGGLELFIIHPAVAEGNFLKASDLEALMMFDGADELGSGKKS